MHSRNKGFTLIELLVVIAIIAILAAILFPVFAQAREKARAISCLSNTKQVALGVVMYAQDYDESYPGSRFWGTGSWSNADPGSEGWVAAVQPYIKNLAVFKCPDDSRALTPCPWSDNGWAGVYVSYAGNAYHAGWNGSSNPALGPISYFGASWMEATAQTLAKMTKPAETILTAEKLGADINNPALLTSANWVPGNNCSTGVPTGDVFTADTGDYGQAIPDGSRDPKLIYPNGRNGAVSAHHSDHGNFTFCDGHVKSLVPYATDPDPVNHPELNMWDGTRQ